MEVTKENLRKIVLGGGFFYAKGTEIPYSFTDVIDHLFQDREFEGVMLGLSKSPDAVRRITLIDSLQTLLEKHVDMFCESMSKED